MSGPLRKAVQRGAIKAQGKVSPPSGATIREVDKRSGFHLPGWKVYKRTRSEMK